MRKTSLLLSKDAADTFNYLLKNNGEITDTLIKELSEMSEVFNKICTFNNLNRSDLPMLGTLEQITEILTEIKQCRIQHTSPQVSKKPKLSKKPRSGK